jgi:cytochrome c-type biogenesis protein CcmE
MMNKKQKNRLIAIISLIFILGAALGLILYALKQNINLFYTPTALLKASIQPNQIIRIGGYVKNHSVHYDTTGQQVDFIVTDRLHELKVTYQGVLPNLFREGQSVVVTGMLDNSIFKATEVLAKHDEKYMPRAIKAMIEKQQHDS